MRLEPRTLNSLGLQVIRFNNEEIINDLNTVLATIKSCIN